MKLMVIGIGDCGCRIAHAFGELNKQARNERGASIITCAYAVNNDKDVLREVARAKWDWLKPVLIHGSAGDGKSSEAGAALLLQESERVMLAMRLGAFVNTDAFLFVAGAGGSLGSGGVPVIANLLKERHVGKPIYAMIVLPFDSELDDPDIVRNTAVCLKSVDKAADAVVLVDNGGLGVTGAAMAPQKMTPLNKELISPFYDLLCAGEMVGPKQVSNKVLDAGDITQTLAGWTAIGHGKARLSSSPFRFRKQEEFEEISSESLRAIEAMNLALMRLSVDCKLEDSGKALFLLSAPAKQANLDMIQVLSRRLRELAPNAEIRDGSLYGSRDSAQVTVLISQLIYVDRIKSYYDRAAKMAPLAEK